jgi:hypothetical protein
MSVFLRKLLPGGGTDGHAVDLLQHFQSDTCYCVVFMCILCIPASALFRTATHQCPGPHPVPPCPAEYIAAVYAEMRQLEAQQTDGGSATYTTPRTLLSILRLSQSLAKLRWVGVWCVHVMGRGRVF